MLDRIEASAAGSRSVPVHYGTALSSFGQDRFKFAALFMLVGTERVDAQAEWHLVESIVPIAHA